MHQPLTLAVCLSLSACLGVTVGCGGPECPAGEVVASLPAPFDDLAKASEKSWYCQSAGRYMIVHPQEDGDVDAVFALYGDGVGDLKPATAWTSSSFSGFNPYSEGTKQARLVSNDHVYELKIQRHYSEPVVVVELTDESDSRLPAGLQAKAPPMIERAAALFDLLEGSPEAKVCTPQDIPPRVLELSTAVLADVRNIDDGESVLRYEKLVETMATVPAYAIPKRTGGKEPVVRPEEKAFDAGSLTGRIYLVGREPRAILCAIPYEVTNGIVVEFTHEHWGEEGKAALTALQAELVNQEGPAQVEALKQGIGEDRIVWHDALVPQRSSAP
ncbi:MAG: hypothetical protein EP329_20605 [Deltaproteobacteria bacterium]|nr:MAG: hypothetical protein EP329_20605 [Deltaproteobacteria bacterium]